MSFLFSEFCWAFVPWKRYLTTVFKHSKNVSCQCVRTALQPAPGYSNPLQPTPGGHSRLLQRTPGHSGQSNPLQATPIHSNPLQVTSTNSNLLQATTTNSSHFNPLHAVLTQCRPLHLLQTTLKTQPHPIRNHSNYTLFETILGSLTRSRISNFRIFEFYLFLF